jgi:hypothetical protein
LVVRVATLTQAAVLEWRTNSFTARLASGLLIPASVSVVARDSGALIVFGTLVGAK